MKRSKIRKIVLCMFTVFCIQALSLAVTPFAGQLLNMSPVDFPMSVVNAHPLRVVDEAELLSAEEESRLLSLVDEISESQQFDVVIATVNSLEGEDIQDYAADFYDYGGYGMGDNYDGVMFLISMEEREWFILTTGYGIDVINDAKLDDLEDEVVPYLSAGEYAEAFYIFAESCEEEVIYTNENGVEEAKPSLLISVFIGLILGLIPAFAMRGKLKSVRMQSGAGGYERRETRRITTQRDIFLYHTINRVPRETESSSGGSSTFRGSSGRSHGGRGGGF